MRVRSSLVIGIFASMLAVAPSGAANGCPLLTDPRGDDRFHGTAVERPGDDLLSADVWADSRNLTAVMRLDGLPSSGEGGSPELEGFQWMVALRAQDGVIDLTVLERAGRYFFQMAYGADVEGQPGSVYKAEYAAGSVNGAKGTVRVSVPLRVLASYTSVRPGTRWSVMGASVYQLDGTPAYDLGPVRSDGPSGVAFPRDNADGKMTPVVVGRPRCSS